jgi:hypothetical protein
MVEMAMELGGLSEAVVFLNHFRGLPDPCQAGKVLYPLAEVLLLRLLAVPAGAATLSKFTKRNFQGACSSQQPFVVACQFDLLPTGAQEIDRCQV